VEKFAQLIDVTAEALRVIEKGKMLWKCHRRTLVGLSKAMEQIGVRFTRGGWEIVEGGPAMPNKPLDRNV